MFVRFFSWCIILMYTSLILVNSALLEEITTDIRTLYTRILFAINLKRPHHQLSYNKINLPTGKPFKPVVRQTKIVGFLKNVPDDKISQYSKFLRDMILIRVKCTVIFNRICKILLFKKNSVLENYQTLLVIRIPWRHCNIQDPTPRINKSQYNTYVKV